MGNSKKELESIKAKLLKSHPSEISSLLRYLEDLLAAWDNSNPSPPLTSKQIKKFGAELSVISLSELETIIEFALEQIPLSRTSDKASCLVGTLSKIDFYTKELKYSKIEKFIFNLRSINT